MVAKDTHTPPRSFRCGNELWADAKAAAADEGLTITDAITEDLERRVRRWKKRQGITPPPP